MEGLYSTSKDPMIMDGDVYSPECGFQAFSSESWDEQQLESLRLAICHYLASKRQPISSTTKRKRCDNLFPASSHYVQVMDFLLSVCSSENQLGRSLLRNGFVKSFSSEEKPEEILKGNFIWSCLCAGQHMNGLTFVFRRPDIPSVAQGGAKETCSSVQKIGSKRKKRQDCTLSMLSWPTEVSEFLDLYSAILTCMT